MFNLLFAVKGQTFAKIKKVFFFSILAVLCGDPAPQDFN